MGMSQKLGVYIIYKYKSNIHRYTGIPPKMACSLGVWAPCQLTPQTCCQVWMRQSSCGFIHQCGESWPGCRKFQAVQYPIFRQTIDKPKLFKLIVKPAWKPSLAMSLPTAYGADMSWPPPNIRDVWKGNMPKQVCENWRGLRGAHPVWSVLLCFVPEMDCQWMAFGFQLLDLNSCTAAGYQTQGTTAVPERTLAIAIVQLLSRPLSTQPSTPAGCSQLMSSHCFRSHEASCNG